jgi:arylsulfatase A-like enzyme
VLRAVATRLFAVLLFLALGSCSSSETRSPGNILLVILDTTRADHLSSYGYERSTTPNLDRLAAEGERYTQAWAQSSWTLPTVATILTGLPPNAHGAGRTGAGMYGVRPEVPTLAEKLQSAGWDTAAFVNVVWCSPRISSLDRGFDLYDFQTSDETNRGQRDARATTDAAVTWLRARGDAPFLAVVHYFDPHLTYDPPAPFDVVHQPEGRSLIPPGFGSAEQTFGIRDGSIELDPAQRRSLVARYDGELAFADEQFGRLRAEMEQLGSWDDTLVVVVADHGEEFWDHGGFEHGHTHYRELNRVPLIVRRPGAGDGRVIDARVRQLDVAPTVLEFAGLWPSAGLPGRPLDDRGSPYAVAEGTLWGGELLSVRGDAGALILDRSTGALQYYEPADTLELSPASELPPHAAGLKRLLDALPRLEGPGPPRQPTADELEQLRSLGYVR